MRTVGNREVVITRRYNKARERLPQYRCEIDEELELFCQNPHYPSLKLQELDRNKYKNWWAYYVNQGHPTIRRGGQLRAWLRVMRAE